MGKAWLEAGGRALLLPRKKPSHEGQACGGAGGDCMIAVVMMKMSV